MREAMAAEGVSVACYSVGATLYGSDAVEECLLRHIEVAAALGSPLLHHTLIFSTREAGPAFEEALADTPFGSRLIREEQLGRPVPAAQLPPRFLSLLEEARQALALEPENERLRGNVALLEN